MVSKYFESIPYRLNEETGLIDYDECEKFALRIRPKILIAGTSAYSRLIDYSRMREIADKCGAYLLADMAHISGLVVAGAIPSPFEYADVVTTTTHKSLRGPRGAMIFFRKGQRGVDKKLGNKQKGNAIMYDLEDRINASVFPGLQGGPHNQSITALAVALRQANSPEFKTYIEQVIKILAENLLSMTNSKAFGESLQKCNFNLVSGGTDAFRGIKDNHLLLIDLRSKGINGSKAEAVCEQASIVLNKNTIPGDKSAMNPNGLRVGTPAMTSRGLMEDDFVRIGEFIGSAVDIAAEVQKEQHLHLGESGPKLVDFKRVLAESPPGKLLELKSQVEDFASAFPTAALLHSSSTTTGVSKELQEKIQANRERALDSCQHRVNVSSVDNCPQKAGNDCWSWCLMLCAAATPGCRAFSGTSDIADIAFVGVAEVLGCNYPVCRDPEHQYGLVHRLDRFTSGAVLCATSYTAFYLSQLQFAARRVLKIYLALCHGHIPHWGGTKMIEAPLSGSRQVDGSWRSVVDQHGRRAKTEILQVVHLRGPGDEEVSLVKAWDLRHGS
eukprot:s658_g35.t1